MNRKETIKEIKNLLQAGYIVKASNGYNPFVMWLSNDLKYIMYRHCGQSAVKNNLKELTWLVNNTLDKSSIYFKTVETIFD